MVSQVLNLWWGWHIGRGPGIIPGIQGEYSRKYLETDCTSEVLYWAWAAHTWHHKGVMASSIGDLKMSRLPNASVSPWRLKAAYALSAMFDMWLMGCILIGSYTHGQEVCWWQKWIYERVTLKQSTLVSNNPHNPPIILRVRVRH